MQRWIAAQHCEVPVLTYFYLALWSSLYVQIAPAQTINVRWYNDAACTTEISPNAGILWTKESQGGQCIDILSTLAQTTQSDFRGYTLDCAPDWGLTTAPTSYSATTLVVRIENQGCGLCPGGTSGCVEYYQAAAATYCQQYQGDINIWMTWDYPSAVTQCGEPIPTNVVNYYATVGGDPVTWIGDRREEFDLPIGVLSTLLRSKDMQVLASARQGYTKDQWIDHIVIADSVSDVVVDVEIKKNLTRFHRASLPPNAFETMDVKMEWCHHGPIEVMPPGDALFTHWSGISLGFGRVRYYGQTDAGVAPRREAIIVQSRSLKILIISSTAREYFPEQAHLGVEYSHLDIEVLEMSDEEQLEGILPELWRFRPMSEQTRLLRKEPNVDALVNISNAVRNMSIKASDVKAGAAKPPILMTSAADEKCAEEDSEETKFVAVASVGGFAGNSASLSEGNAWLEKSASAADI